MSGQAARRGPAFDTTVPNAARMYDFLLGGKDNFASDRDAVDELVEVAPDTPRRARLNRAFMGRAVRYVASQGVRQFLDVGAGLPTQQNVHQVAQSVAPDARIVYVDNDRDKSGCVHAVRSTRSDWAGGRPGRCGGDPACIRAVHGDVQAPMSADMGEACTCT